MKVLVDYANNFNAHITVLIEDKIIAVFSVDLQHWDSRIAPIIATMRLMDNLPLSDKYIPPHVDVNCGSNSNA